MDFGGITSYAKQTIGAGTYKEDFAETVSLYVVKGSDWLKNKAPNRYRCLNAYLKSIKSK